MLKLVFKGVSNISLNISNDSESNIQINILNLLKIWVLQSGSVCFRVVQSGSECFRVLQSFSECFRVLQSASECFRVLQSASECYRALQSASDCFRLLQRGSEWFRLLQSASECFFLSTLERYHQAQSNTLGRCTLVVKWWSCDCRWLSNYKIGYRQNSKSSNS